MIFILGLDGLEYDFVNRWNLLNLMQQEYGKIEVPVDKKIGVPMSPEVWATFLTGKHVKAEFEEPTAPLNPIFKVLKFLRNYINVSLGLSKKIKTNFPIAFHGRYHKGFPVLNETTFLDVTNSKK